MENMLKYAIVALAIVILAAFALFNPFAWNQPESNTSKIISMDNPASSHCVNSSGKLEIRKTSAGEYGVCVFPDGSECEEWKYFRGECKPGDTKTANLTEAIVSDCTAKGGALETVQDYWGVRKYCVFKPAIANPASVYCTEQGGESEIRKFSSGEAGFCVFPDRSECDEWKYFRGECKPGDNTCKDLCGDGVCQNVVCFAIGCPCAETNETCAVDCKS